MNVQATAKNPKAVIVVDHMQTGFECHKVGCQDLTKAAKLMKIANSWVEENLVEAEINFNEDLGVNAGFDDPWIWSRDVNVFPCAIAVQK